ncbi:MAG: hypothetical protein KGD74_03835, partial [Candidatus Lokiarchaeota archaeon]|nr:hypothetical protein [Candidatus Lokiarchaeota archaeon]
LDIIIKGTDEQNVKVLTDALNLKMNILKEKAKNESSFIAINILENEAHKIKMRLMELPKTI